MTVVKVCGIRDVASARAAVVAGADWLGFHFCSSRRQITPAEAGRILEELDPRPYVVGVFLDQSAGEVEEVAGQVGLDAVQLHGSERPGFSSSRRVIKALKVRDGAVPDPAGWPDPILLDSWSADQRGGTGRTWDFEAALPLLQGRRVILAGGLEPANVGEVVARFRPYGVDVSSGVESAVGVKDPNAVLAFVQAVRESDERR